MFVPPISQSSSTIFDANESSLQNRNISGIKQVSDSIFSNRVNLLVPTRQTYKLKDFQIKDISNTEEAKKHVEIMHNPLPDELETFIIRLTEKAQKEFSASLVMEVDYNKSDSLLIFPYAFVAGDIPFNVTDAFEIVFNYGIENKLIGLVKEVLLDGVSAIDNTSLVENLEKIRCNKNLDDKEKIFQMERELFSGPHAGKSILRRLNRVGYEPVRNSLEIDLLKEIIPFCDLKFKVKPSASLAGEGKGISGLF